MLTLRDVLAFRGVRSGGSADIGEIALWPLADADLANLPPTFVVAAECDPLCSHAESYGSRILAAGGKAQWIVEKRQLLAHCRDDPPPRPVAAAVRQLGRLASFEARSARASR